MDNADSKRDRHVGRTIVALAAVFGVLQTATAVDLMANLTKPLVTGVLNLIGLSASDSGHVLQIGKLQVPWTGDCAGLNILAVLLAVILWTWRDRPLDRRLVWRLLSALPLAFGANLARIFTLIAYRAWQYPAVESPQLHYFFGFLWILPVVGWFAAPSQDLTNQTRRRWLEALHIAATLALLAPLNAGPVGWIVSLCALTLLLPHSPAKHERGPSHQIVIYVWFIAAVLIAIMRMESLWLPWLLACPFVHRFTWRGGVPQVLTLVGTVPVLAWNPWLATIALSGAAWWAWRALRPEMEEGQFESLSNWPGYARGVMGIYFLLPFVSSLLPALPTSPAASPDGAMIRSVAPNARQIRLLDQPSGLGMVWYEAFGDGRHHTLEVCMRYRGIELIESPHFPEIMTDGAVWYSQYFIQQGRLISSYTEYLAATSWPLSTPGTHIIMTAANDSWSEERFAQEGSKLSRRLTQNL
jgi:exosortase/archaeosortase family protein